MSLSATDLTAERDNVRDDRGDRDEAERERWAMSYEGVTETSGEAMRSFSNSGEEGFFRNKGFVDMHLLTTEITDEGRTSDNSSPGEEEEEAAEEMGNGRKIILSQSVSSSISHGQ